MLVLGFFGSLLFGALFFGALFFGALFFGALFLWCAAASALFEASGDGLILFSRAFATAGCSFRGLSRRLAALFEGCGHKSGIMKFVDNISL